MILPYLVPEYSSPKSDGIMYWCCKSVFSNSLVILFSLSSWDSHQGTLGLFFFVMYKVSESHAISITMFILYFLHEGCLQHTSVSQHNIFVSGFELLSQLLTSYFKTDASSSATFNMVSRITPLRSGVFMSLNIWSFRVNQQSNFSVSVCLVTNLLNYLKLDDSFKTVTTPFLCNQRKTPQTWNYGC